jgi:hypothetical protein
MYSSTIQSCTISFVLFTAVLVCLNYSTCSCKSMARGGMRGRLFISWLEFCRIRGIAGLSNMAIPFFFNSDPMARGGMRCEVVFSYRPGQKSIGAVRFSAPERHRPAGTLELARHREAVDSCAPAVLGHGNWRGPHRRSERRRTSAVTRHGNGSIGVATSNVPATRPLGHCASTQDRSGSVPHDGTRKQRVFYCGTDSETQYMYAVLSNLRCSCKKF